MRHDLDIAFVTHANERTGFGHASRCAQLAQYISRESRGLRLALVGDFSRSARKVLERWRGFQILDTEDWTARLGFYDRMDDTENPEVVDLVAFSDMRAKVGRSVFMANALEDPFENDESFSEVLVIGYKLGGPRQKLPFRYWGLGFSPVLLEYRPDYPFAHKQDGRVFVALGGSPSVENLEKVLKAVSYLSWVQDVVVLSSPVSEVHPKHSWLSSRQTIEVLSSIPSVGSELERAALVITSYGHLGYEALSLGRPCCIVGQKKFQAEYADKLADAGLCISLGRIEDLSVAQIVEKLPDTEAEMDGYGDLAAKLVSRCGLANIGKILIANLHE